MVSYDFVIKIPLYIVFSISAVLVRKAIQDEERKTKQKFNITERSIKEERKINENSNTLMHLL